MQIGPYSAAYATIAFNPQAMQNYSSYFEATLENMPATAKHRAIAFEVSGDGNLPRFTVQKPSLRNKKGQTLMLFKRTVVNKSDSQVLVLGNDGTLPTKVCKLYDWGIWPDIRPKKNLSLGLRSGPRPNPKPKPNETQIQNLIQKKNKTKKNFCVQKIKEKLKKNFLRKFKIF